ncbi:SDR family NAD(P)-dependent oxidoreductase [Flavobacterium sp. Sd200]|uniref:SDR family oxidoreductase n=1 Tax=Flavobacterium sp. Sd200 TaxID=2692211 RepID=UPI00137131A1|nr:SDR family NAD(P)-dependent oxidoreductase [Flavobacterium sp. Sd200]MXN90498.1 SDR family NAD(P)-dependent oxidoreductase [Flavobacterium sp. Sd200]
MKTKNNTILITGGGSGIGFEMAKLFSQENKVIITGRSPERLQKAALQLNNVTTIAADITNEADVKNLVQRLGAEFPELNIVVNNAGLAHYYKLTDDNADAYTRASQEIQTNYLSTVRLTELLISQLKKQEEAAFVNISSITAFAPGMSLPTYGVSKAALHSYSQVLRISLEKVSNIKVFEIMPPFVDTDFSAEIGGSKGISPVYVAYDVLDALNKNEYEKHVAGTADFYKLFLSSPAAALEALNSGSN